MGEWDERWVELVRAGTVMFGAGFERIAHQGRWQAELRSTYRKRALETHPDRAAALGRRPEDLLRQFREVTEAYALLAAHALAGREAAVATVAAASARGATARSPDTRHPPHPPDTRHPPPPRPAPPPPRPPATRHPPGHQAAAQHQPPPARPAARPSPPAAPRSGASPSPFAPPAAAPGTGPVPGRRLRLAEFLYYSGRVSWSQFVAAVAWQRRQRPSLGRIAVELGFLHQRTVASLLEQRRREGMASEPFGAYAIRQGWLTAAQLLAMLGRQQRLQRRIGVFFIEHGLLEETELEEARVELSRHNARVAARAA